VSPVRKDLVLTMFREECTLCFDGQVGTSPDVGLQVADYTHRTTPRVYWSVFNALMEDVLEKGGDMRICILRRLDILWV